MSDNSEKLPTLFSEAQINMFYQLGKQVNILICFEVFLPEDPMGRLIQPWRVVSIYLIARKQTGKFFKMSNYVL